MTSDGTDYASGLYGDVEPLKPYPITNHMLGSHFYCTYSFHGVKGQRILLRLTQLQVGFFDEQKKR